MKAIHDTMACSKCGRRILVISLSFGTPHQSVNTVICADCLVIDEAWALAYPDDAQHIRDWLQSSNQCTNSLEI